ncbi:MAG: hypothetical protein QI197_07280 [Candidatus Korarchaeota archaeon]|nr:hypothetical protein [Candidatus Korarchaeota archaeon]
MLLLMASLLQAQTIVACPPTAGYVGAIYEQRSSKSGILSYLRDSGIGRGMGLEVVKYTPYGYQGPSMESVRLTLGKYEGGGRVEMYIFPGSKYTLVMVETDAELSEAPLLYAESILSGYLNASKIVEVLKSPNSISPPIAVAKWYGLEKGTELRTRTLKCGVVYSKFSKPISGKVGVVANEIDYSLSFDMLRDALEGRGVPVDYLGYGPDALVRAMRYAAVIFLGGHKAPRTGPSVYPILASNISDLMGTGWIILARSWGPGGTALVIAGIDRYATREAVRRFVSSEWMDRLEAAVKAGVPITSQAGGDMVSVLRSHGSCGFIPQPSLDVSVVGRYAYAHYAQTHSNPCVRLELLRYGVEGREVTIELKKVPVGRMCIACLGVVEADIRIGPLDPGSYTLCINGTCTQFMVGG